MKLYAKEMVVNMRRKNKNKKIIMFSLVLLMCMMVGYSAFNTNINLKAKGNIIEINAEKLKQKIVSEGDGLYKDSYEERYIYKGKDPNNYIKFNGNTWRIIAIEKDNTLKIMKTESIAKKEYDELNHRNNANNTFCENTSKCNVWAKQEGIYKGYNKLGTVTEDATLNTYLNNEYLSTLDSKYITTHTFNVGGTSGESETIEKHIEDEKRVTWQGKVGLITATDYLKASTNPSCTSIYVSKKVGTICKENNYLALNIDYRIITPLHGSYADDNYYSWYISKEESVGDADGSGTGGYGDTSIKLDILPVVYLSNTVTLKGKGTKTEMYEIK